MEIHRLAVLRDNYIFVLHDPLTHQAMVVDPAEAAPVLHCLQTIGATLTAILNTHHHHDHIGGNGSLLEHFPQATVYGGSRDRGRIPGQQVFLTAGDQVVLGDRRATVLFVPGHTRAHIAYYFPPHDPNQPGDLFCGDTLFAGGCGRLFEGTPAEMMQSLEQLRALPGQTRIWCAHEYTEKNLEFALLVDPENAALQARAQRVRQQRLRNEATIPALLADEQQTNPFLRWDQPALQKATHCYDDLATFTRLRQLKDHF